VAPSVRDRQQLGDAADLLRLGIRLGEQDFELDELLLGRVVACEAGRPFEWLSSGCNALSW
jgi:hypothetical protein